MHSTYHPFVIKLRDALIRHQVATEETIIGCSADELASLMARQNVTRLPRLYVDFMRVMGKKAGDYFGGSELFVKAQIMFDMKHEAIELLQEDESTFQLPADAFVFLAHQTYIFMYFQTQVDADDPAIFMYHEGNQVAKPNGVLSALLQSELNLHLKYK